MLLGVIADDFTGASDIANTLARGGMATRLFVGAAPVTSDCDAGVVALKTRSIDAPEAVAQSLGALAALRGAGARQIVFKYCSTFDSTPAGNIGPVAEALAAALGVRGVVVCPAFPATGRTVYQGHLFVGDRLVSETGMNQHPLTPMTDPDLMRWLGRQTAEPPGLVPLAVVRAGPAAIAAALAVGPCLMIVDAADDADLRAIAAAVAEAPLVTGASGVAIGLPANFARHHRLGGGAPAFAAQVGPVLCLAGSCSAATRAQVARHAARHPAFAFDVAALCGAAPAADAAIVAALAFACANRDAQPLNHSSVDAAARSDSPLAAAAIEAGFAAIARGAVAAGFTRLVVAEGETSGAVVGALGLTTLDIGPEICAGVSAVSPPALRWRSNRATSAMWISSPPPPAVLPMADSALREAIARLGRSLFDRGLTHGAAGNISARTDDGGLLVTPTNVSLGALDPAMLSRFDAAGCLVEGPAPTKEMPLHNALYATRAGAGAVVHLHSAHAVAVSMLPDLDPADALPPLTAYYLMGVGRTALLPYHRPGDPGIAAAIKGLAGRYSAVLLANHGPVVAGDSLETAVWAMDELEATARLHLLLNGRNPVWVPAHEVTALRGV